MEEILNTKLYIPPIRPELVPRPRLIKRLNKGLHHKLTLISAPAGFGKTTLVCEWISNLGSATRDKSQVGYKIAWLSLDEGDNDTARFLTYLIAALNQAKGSEPLLGESARTQLQTAQPPINAILTSLINEAAGIPDDVIIILDDYNVIESSQVNEAVAFFLEHLPPHIHLIIATRVDPQLSLSRLRACDQLTELRARDLRFTASEAADFLNRVMGLDLTSKDIAALETRTEGWIAGLQLAAISLRGQADRSRSIQSFTGSHRLVLDYLIEEVLDRQSETIQNFLLQTAILERINDSLCNAVTGQANGQETLEMLEHSNLFIVSLDNRRHWYRYHHLFADLLRRRLNQMQPEQEPILHLRASEWYEENGYTEQAIEHAVRAEEYTRAAVLAELAWPEMHMNYKGISWLRWVKAIPDKLIRSRPVLSTGYGWSLIDSGDLERADLRLRDAEHWLETRASMDEQPENIAEEQVNLDKQALRSLSGSIANARAYITQARGDVAATEMYTQRALDLLPENDHFERGLSAILQGFAYWSSGNLDAAQRAISAAIANMQFLGKIPFIISFTSYMADIMIAQGRLNEAKKTYIHIMDVAKKGGEADLKETAVVHLGLSELYHEQGDLQAARWHMLKTEELGELPGFPPWYRHWIYMQVRMKESEGDLDGSIKILTGANHLYYRHPIPDIRPLSALMARALLATGKLNEALLWVRERSLSVDDDLSYLSEFEHITLARILIAQHKSDRVEGLIEDAIGLLEHLLKAAEEGGRMGSAIEILLLKALAYEAKGDIQSALKPLERALRLAEPEDYLRIFVDQGPAMSRLLYEALKLKIAPGYISRLLDAFPVASPEASTLTQPADSKSELFEPLSERELEVLQLIADGLTNQAIGSRLYLSLNTVKVHTRNIYGKLGVNRRTQAVAKAKMLGILPSP